MAHKNSTASLVTDIGTETKSDPLHHLQGSDNLIRSFDTVTSQDVDAIFSDVEDDLTSSSNTSLYVSDLEGHETSNFGLSEQDATREDTSLIANLPDPLPTPLQEQLGNLAKRGPFRCTPFQIPDEIQYWYTYELYRLSTILQLEVGDLYNSIKQLNSGKTQLSPQELQTSMRTICNNRGIAKIPVCSNPPRWTIEDGLYYNRNSGDCASFTAKLRFNEELAGPIFDFQLNPIKYERGCRFYRKFGADRFLTIEMPYFDEDTFRSSTKPQSKRVQQLRALTANDRLHNTLFQWLVSTQHHIVGRQWRVFYVESKSGQSRKKRDQEGILQRMHLFAVDGTNFQESQSPDLGGRHTPTSLLDFLQWHIPLCHNLESTCLKLFARIQLGLSKTTPTLLFRPHEFIYVPDKKPQSQDGSIEATGEVMNDGCARISLPFAKAVWALYGKPGEAVPSAFQARISGAKGLWIVDYRDTHPHVSNRGWWIEISDSQLKIQPHPKDRIDAEDALRTFEIVKYAQQCEPANLNVELINILENRRVPRSALRLAVEKDLDEYLSSLKKALADPIALRMWLHRTSTHADISFSGGMPSGLSSEMNLLLESGFDPETSPYLIDCLRRLLRTELDQYVEKLKIKLEHSTTVFCIPDPYGILQPGEVQLNFSREWDNPVTGLPELSLDGIDVLVSRNPARLPSDVQKVRAVYYHELQHYRNVVIFPTTGHTPLASLLSGGDYDGDTVTVIWEPSLVEKFQGVVVPKLPAKSDCFVQSEKVWVGSVLNSLELSRGVDSFLLTCCSFNGRPNLLGRVAAEHDHIVYAKNINLSHPSAIKLAALCGWLVDGSKQGDTLDSSGLSQLLQEVRSKYARREIAYKKAVDSAKPLRDRRGCINVIDYLKFDVAQKLRERTLCEFEQEYGSKTRGLDGQLTEIANREYRRIEDKSSVDAAKVKLVISHLKKQIRGLCEEYERSCINEERTSANDYTRQIEMLSEKFHALTPLEVDCDINHDFTRQGGGKCTRWSFIKASCFYYHHHKSMVVWKICGDELCRMKARAQGQTWEMTLAMRQFFKPDKRRLQRHDEENDLMNISG